MQDAYACTHGHQRASCTQCVPARGSTHNAHHSHHHEQSARVCCCAALDACTRLEGRRAKPCSTIIYLRARLLGTGLPVLREATPTPITDCSAHDRKTIAHVAPCARQAVPGRARWCMFLLHSKKAVHLRFIRPLSASCGVGMHACVHDMCRQTAGRCSLQAHSPRMRTHRHTHTHASACNLLDQHSAWATVQKKWRAPFLLHASRLRKNTSCITKRRKQASSEANAHERAESRARSCAGCRLQAMHAQRTHERACLPKAQAT